jgi:hypothetical protein
VRRVLVSDTASNLSCVHQSVFRKSFSMPSKPLEVLKKGMGVFKNQVKAQKETLQKKLAKREKLILEDETWLDTAGNLVEEDCMIETLETAS